MYFQFFVLFFYTFDDPAPRDGVSPPLRREDPQQMVGLVSIAAGSASAMMTAGDKCGFLWSIFWEHKMGLEHGILLGLEREIILRLYWDCNRLYDQHHLVSSKIWCCGFPNPILFLRTQESH